MSSGVSFIVDFGIKQRSKEIPSRDMRHSEIQYYCHAYSSVTLNGVCGLLRFESTLGWTPAADLCSKYTRPERRTA